MGLQHPVALIFRRLHELQNRRHGFHSCEEDNLESLYSLTPPLYRSQWRCGMKGSLIRAQRHFAETNGIENRHWYLTHPQALCDRRDPSNPTGHQSISVCTGGLQLPPKILHHQLRPGERCWIATTRVERDWRSCSRGRRAVPFGSGEAQNTRRPSTVSAHIRT